MQGIEVSSRDKKNRVRRRCEREVRMNDKDDEKLPTFGKVVILKFREKYTRNRSLLFSRYRCYQIYRLSVIVVNSIVNIIRAVRYYYYNEQHGLT